MLRVLGIRFVYQFIELWDGLGSWEDFLGEVRFLILQEERVEPLKQRVVDAELDLRPVTNRFSKIA